MGIHEELPEKDVDSLLSFLNKCIKTAIRFLAILMVLVIFLGVADVVYVLYKRLMLPPLLLLGISDIFHVFAAFLTVLIAIEIYQNIVLYVRTNIIPVKLVVATALMAIVRKVIILDFTIIEPLYVFAMGVVSLALGVTYFLIGMHDKEQITRE